MKKAISILMMLLSLAGVQQSLAKDKPRVIILTDGEVDDRCSMVHLLLYANDCDIAALIESNSCFQKRGWSRVHWLQKELDDYAAVFPNLRKHDPAYPSPAYLRSVVFVGDEEPSHVVVDNNASLRFPGEEPQIDPTTWAETPGSRRIVDVLLDDDPRPVYIQAWGGGNTAAKAFQVIKDKHPMDYERAMRKVVMYNIWYQDGAGSYIERFHPLVTMLISYHFSGTWDYGSQAYTTDFVDKYLHNNHGPLCADYVQTNISEGDSPSFLYALANGLRSYEDPTYGGWGGLFFKVPSYDRVYRDADAGSYNIWREFVLRDFQARAQWCIADSYEKANHAPIVTVRGGTDITVHSGQQVEIVADVTDRDSLDYDYLWQGRKELMQQMGVTKELFIRNFQMGPWPRFNIKWWQYRDAGTYDGFVELRMTKRNSAFFTAPTVSVPKTIHLICQATDIGLPNLTGFQRVIVTVMP